MRDFIRYEFRRKIDQIFFRLVHDHDWQPWPDRIGWQFCPNCPAARPDVSMTTTCKCSGCDEMSCGLPDCDECVADSPPNAAWSDEHGGRDAYQEGWDDATEYYAKGGSFK